MMADQAVSNTALSQECQIARSCHEHEKLICAVAYQLTKDRDRACQLAASTFQKALESQGEYAAQEHPKAWLLTTLRKSYQEDLAGVA